MNNSAFPIVDMNTMVQEALDPAQLYITKSIVSQDKIDKINWQPSYQLVGFSVPDVIDFSCMKKLFKLHVDCQDKRTGATFGKAIYFGDPSDFIWTGDKNERLKKVNSLTQKDNPLHADYWRTQLCLFSDDFRANVSRMVNFLLDKRLAKINNLKPKKDFTPIIAKRQASLSKKK